MSNYSTSIFDFSKTVSKLFNEYGDDIRFEIEESLPEVGKKGRKKLKEISPHDTGVYRANWSYTTTERKVGVLNAVIHETKKYQLTHLLENGHWNVRTNSFTEGIPHIGPAQEYVNKELEETVKKRISKI